MQKFLHISAIHWIELNTDIITVPTYEVKSKDIPFTGHGGP
jgi:hypothetical protein